VVVVSPLASPAPEHSVFQRRPQRLEGEQARALAGGMSLIGRSRSADRRAKGFVQKIATFA
jgi:hypothetical protein